MKFDPSIAIIAAFSILFYPAIARAGGSIGFDPIQEMSVQAQLEIEIISNPVECPEQNGSDIETAWESIPRGRKPCAPTSSNHLKMIGEVWEGITGFDINSALEERGKRKENFWGPLTSPLCNDFSAQRYHIKFRFSTVEGVRSKKFLSTPDSQLPDESECRQLQ
ncbi:MAG: hypothetical protein ACP5D7_19020 [Limnospira sp.]